MIRNDVSWSEYLGIKRMNPSTLVHGRKSMLHLKQAIDKKIEDTEAMRFGRGIHCLCLTPDEFEEMFAVMPDFHLDEGNKKADGSDPESPKATKYYKEAKRQWEASITKDVLRREQYDEILMMIETLHSKPKVRDIFERAGSNREVTLEGEICGVPMKGRVDLLTTDLIPDIKTCRSIVSRKFGSDCADMGYNFKMSIYRELVRQNTCDRECCYIAVEKNPPYDVCVRTIPAITLDNKLREAKQILERYKQCLESGVWPGVDQGNDDEILYVPSWEDEPNLDWSAASESDENEEVEVYF